MAHAGSGRVRLQVVIALVAVLVLAVVLAYVALSATTVTVPEAGGIYTEGIVGSPDGHQPRAVAGQPCRSGPRSADL